jgi:hypothetical protein
MQYQMLVFVHNIKTMWYGAVVAYDIIILTQHTPKKPAENKHQSTLLIFRPTAGSMPPM